MFYKIGGVMMAPFIIGGIRSLTERKISDFLLTELKSTVALTFVWIVIISVMEIFAYIFNIDGEMIWIIRLVYLSYIAITIRTFLSIYSRYQQNKKWIHFYKKTFNVSIVGIILSILIPLIGWGFLYLFLTWIRSLLIW